MRETYFLIQLKNNEIVYCQRVRIYKRTLESNVQGFQNRMAEYAHRLQTRGKENAE